MAGFWDNMKKATAVMGATAMGAAAVGGLTAMGSKLYRSRHDRQRQDLREDRDFEMKKVELYKDAYLQDKKINSKDKEVEYKYRNEAQKNVLDLEESKVIYQSGMFRPNYMTDKNGNVMDNRMYAGASLMNTGSLLYQYPQQMMMPPQPGYPAAPGMGMEMNNGAAPAGSIESLQSKLLEIADLRKNNLISEQEYNQMKANILGLDK